MIKNLIFILFTLSLAFSQDKIGTSAANFLGIPMGSKATALGGALQVLAQTLLQSFIILHLFLELMEIN